MSRINHIPARTATRKHLVVRLLVTFTLAAVAASVSGCLAAAAGAAGGYHAHSEGYRVQSPVKKQ